MRTVMLWDVAEHKAVATLSQRKPANLGFTADATRLDSLGGDREVKVWETDIQSATFKP